VITGSPIDDVLEAIRELAEEEQSLFGRGSLDDHELMRLEAIKIELDQCWDLLRRRQVSREAGGKLRPSVEPKQ
jgi:hypothetical protein